MAGTTHTVRARYHGQIAAGFVDVITVAGEAETVTVVNRDGTAELSFVVGADSSVPNPVHLADETHVLPAAIGEQTIDLPSGAAPVVKLISTGAGVPKYSILVN